ncbi:hypothetical protein niasHT_030229 [Heterodera trifolii]|uniref:Pyruvate kinase barrel domain-containing protein n=1 Tax=Heterodera trifolii TaxID=157864 RepID=A0ABD2K379_9BILA
MANVRKTGIICTLGSECRVEMLVQMIENEMDVARMNFGDGDHEGGSAENLEASDAREPTDSENFGFAVKQVLASQTQSVWRKSNNGGTCPMELLKISRDQ